MTVFNLGTFNLVEKTDFTEYAPFFPAVGNLYFLRATLSESSYLTFPGYVLIIWDTRIPPTTDYSWEYRSEIYPNPFPVQFPIPVYSMLPAGVIFRPRARLIKPFVGSGSDNLDCTIEFDDQAFQPL